MNFWFRFQPGSLYAMAAGLFYQRRINRGRNIDQML